MGLRLTIGTVLSILTSILIIHFAQLPADKFLPPYFSYNNMTAKAKGEVVNVQTSYYTEHFWEGNTDTEYYINYQFHPSTPLVLPTGKLKLVPQQTEWQTGAIKGHEEDVKNLPAGTPVMVNYDPYNPLINGISGQGQVSMKANFFSGWLLYFAVFVIITLGYERLTRFWIKSDTE